MSSPIRFVAGTASLLVALAACTPAANLSNTRSDAPSESQLQQFLDPGFVHAESTGAFGPNTVTREIIQDAAGDVWFATFSGVVRYDGNVYTNVTNEAPLAPTRAFSLLRDRGDAIWIGTAGAGVYRYDGDAYTQITTRDGLSSDRVLSMMEDRDGNLWFGHERGGATRLAGTRFTTFGARDGFTDADVSSIAQDGTGRIWFGTREGLFHFDGESFAALEQARHLPKGGFIPTQIDREGQLWFGGGGGLHHFDGERLRRLTSDPVWALDLAADGSIWFGGESELRRVDLARQAQTLPAPVWALPERSDSRLWSGGESEPELIDAGAVGAVIFDVFEDRDGALWIGTFGVARLEAGRIRYLGATTERRDAAGRVATGQAQHLAKTLAAGS